MAGLEGIQKLLQHEFADANLVEAALTHGSSHKGGSDYQRLEFLGDRVLSLVIAEELYTRFPAEKEGPMAARLSLLVRAEACASVGKALQLSQFIKVGASEKRKGVNGSASVLSDVVEALIGALYVDAGLEKARQFILAGWAEMLVKEPSSLKDAKTFVQEWALGQSLALPAYAEVGREGPHHAPVFTIALRVGQHDPVSGKGPSKQMAEMDAAQNFIMREGLR